LDVGLPSTTDFMNGHDLDNYLYPLARRLTKGGRHIVSASGTKRIADHSYLTVGPAIPSANVISDRIHQIVVSASSASPDFKRTIHLALADAELLPPGPVSLEVSYIVGPTRNWMNLWKPTIDSLAPLLGDTPGGRPWNPLDGRIVELSLHSAIDANAGNTVSIGIRSARAEVNTRTVD